MDSWMAQPGLQTRTMEEGVTTTKRIHAAVRRVNPKPNPANHLQTISLMGE